jgi:polyhydroxyalkanoate synthase subunit PhaC
VSTPNDAKRWSNLASLLSRPAPAVGATPADVVHRENKWSLLRYRGNPTKKTPVLIVPSLINRHYVLDLLPGKSFVEFMVAQGHDVFMIDWGRPTDEDRFLTFDDVCDKYIGRAIRKAAALSGTKVHLLGYCLGGTLAAIHAAAHPEHVASIAQLAAPVSFEDDGQLAAWTRSSTFDVGAVLSAFGNVPSWLMQASFQMLRPTMNLSKLVHLVDKAGDDDFLEGFRAMETWANDNVDFPGEVYRRYIQELYRENRLVKGTMRLGGKPARLESITCPVLCITFEHDNIVPAKSASAMLDHIASEDKEHLHLPGGHVGSVVSRAAKKHLWPKISAFWASRDGAEKKAATRERHAKN